MKLKVNLYGNTFNHNLVNGKITSTQGKEPHYLEYVTDGSGEINLFVDRAIYDVGSVKNDKKNYAWLLESKVIAPDLISYYLESKGSEFEKFEKIFTHNEDLLKKDEKFCFLNPIGYWVEDAEHFIKTKLISMIVSDKKYTKQQKIRYKFANKNIDKIDVFGSGFHDIEFKDTGLVNYYFSIVFENDLTDNYFSEKILDCFATKTIPIYCGTKKIINYFDQNGIIFFEKYNLNDISFDLYFNKINAVESNFQKVKEFRLPEDSMYKKYLS